MVKRVHGYDRGQFEKLLCVCKISCNLGQQMHPQNASPKRDGGLLITAWVYSIYIIKKYYSSTMFSTIAKDSTVGSANMTTYTTMLYLLYQSIQDMEGILKHRLLLEAKHKLPTKPTTQQFSMGKQSTHQYI